MQGKMVNVYKLFIVTHHSLSKYFILRFYYYFYVFKFFLDSSSGFIFLLEFYSGNFRSKILYFLSSWSEKVLETCFCRAPSPQALPKPWSGISLGNLSIFGRDFSEKCHTSPPRTCRSSHMSLFSPVDLPRVMYVDTQFFHNTHTYTKIITQLLNLYQRSTYVLFKWQFEFSIDT